MITVDAEIAKIIIGILCFVGTVGLVVACLSAFFEFVLDSDKHYLPMELVAMVISAIICVAGFTSLTTMRDAGVVTDTVTEVTREVDVAGVSDEVRSTGRTNYTMSVVHTIDAHGNVSKETITDDIHVIADVEDGGREYLRDTNTTTTTHYDCILLSFLHVKGDIDTLSQVTELHLSRATLQNQ